MGGMGAIQFVTSQQLINSNIYFSTLFTFIEVESPTHLHILSYIGIVHDTFLTHNLYSTIDHMKMTAERLMKVRGMEKSHAMESRMEFFFKINYLSLCVYLLGNFLLISTVSFLLWKINWTIIIGLYQKKIYRDRKLWHKVIETFEY